MRTTSPRSEIIGSDVRRLDHRRRVSAPFRGIPALSRSRSDRRPDLVECLSQRGDSRFERCDALEQSRSLSRDRPDPRDTRIGVENLRRYVAGEKMLSVVDVARGY